MFDLFKKKSPTHEEKVALAHKCYKPEMVSMVFPGGTKQVSNIIVSLAKIYGVSLEPLTAKEYYDILPLILTCLFVVLSQTVATSILS